jgi:hypothetical protein
LRHCGQSGEREAVPIHWNLFLKPPFHRTAKNLLAKMGGSDKLLA